MTGEERKQKIIKILDLAKNKFTDKKIGDFISACDLPFDCNDEFSTTRYPKILYMLKISLTNDQFLLIDEKIIGKKQVRISDIDEKKCIFFKDQIELDLWLATNNNLWKRN